MFRSRLFLFCIFLVVFILAACSSTEGTVELQVVEATDESTPIPPTDPPPTEAPSADTPAPAEVSTIEDVVYSTAVEPDAEDQSLDIYHLPGSERSLPVVIYAHGSGEDKSSGRLLAKILAKEGYVVIPINYRDEMFDDNDPNLVREAIENGECALRFVVAESEQYGADPNHVIWAGFSAGGWLGSMLAFGEGDLQERLGDADGTSRRAECTATADPAAITAFVASSGYFPGDYWLGDGVEAHWTDAAESFQSFAALGHNPELQIRLIQGQYDRINQSDFYALAEQFTAGLQDAGYDVELLTQSGSHNPYTNEMIAEIQALSDQ